MAEVRDWKPCEAYGVGEIVRHDGRLWIMTYYRAVTSCDEPGNEEYTACWRALDEHLYVKTQIPSVERRGWRRKKTRRLIHIAEADASAYENLQYVERGGFGVPFMPVHHRKSWNPHLVSKLRRQLGISAEDLATILAKRRMRRLKKFDVENIDISMEKHQ